MAKKDKEKGVTSFITAESIRLFPLPPTLALICDASCICTDNSGFGETEYNIYCTTEKRIIETKPLGYGSANTAEFVAIVRSVQLAKRGGIPYVFSDSLNAIKWFLTGTVKTSVRDSTALNWAIEKMKELKGEENMPQVHFWRNKDWYENPADFGRKGYKRPPTKEGFQEWVESLLMQNSLSELQSKIVAKIIADKAKTMGYK